MQTQETVKPTSEDQHYNTIVSAITQGRIVPFLGAGVNLCDRPSGTPWEPGRYLPNGGELANYLAERFGYGPSADLARVSQYVALMGGGQGALYEALRELFSINYPPTLLHKFLAVLPSMMRDRGAAPPYQLIVTTNYDDVLERAFHAAGEPFDVVSYVAAEEDSRRGMFRHWSYVFKPAPRPRPPERADDQDEVDYRLELARYRRELAEYERQQAEGGFERAREQFWDPRRWPPDVGSELINTPNEYVGLALTQRPVILKIHGAVDRITPPEGEERLDSFVITEDDYIDYLTRKDISQLLPISLSSKLRRSNFWFLGYSLRDWNLRVILRRIWGKQQLRFNSWAVQLDPEDLDQVFWVQREVIIINRQLHAYIHHLCRLLGARPYFERLAGRFRAMEESAAASGRRPAGGVR